MLPRVLPPPPLQTHPLPSSSPSPQAGLVSFLNTQYCSMVPGCGVPVPPSPSPSPSPTPSASPQPAWPQRGYDLRHTGASPNLGPTGTVVVKWAYTAGDTIESSPVIDAAGTVYFGCDDDNVYAVDGTTGALVRRLGWWWGGRPFEPCACVRLCHRVAVSPHHRVTVFSASPYLLCDFWEYCACPVAAVEVSYRRRCPIDARTLGQLAVRWKQRQLPVRTGQDHGREVVGVRVSGFCGAGGQPCSNCRPQSDWAHSVRPRAPARTPA
jgi:hypothetical protein